MEIGRGTKYNNFQEGNHYRLPNVLSTAEKQQRFKKIIYVSIVVILFSFFISWYILANYTSVIEQIIFKNIAKSHGYELSYSST